MPNLIEEARSGRSTCRSCRKPIEKGSARLGVEVEGFDADKPGHVWHHLACAAQKMPGPTREALGQFTGELPNRAEIEALLETAAQTQKLFPYAERAPTGRAHCAECHGALEKGAFRVAIERQLEVGAMTRSGASYLHPGCATQRLSPEELAKVRANSKLKGAELDELNQAMTAPAQV